MDSRNLDVSVVVLSYNQEHAVEVMLKALLAQKFSGSYEIIITDDGSTAEFFHCYRDALNESIIPVKYVWQQDQYYRAASARNSGIRLSRGRIILFLDGDMVPALDAVQKHHDAHVEEKMIVAGGRKWRGEINEDFHKFTDQPIAEFIEFLEHTHCVDEDSIIREKTERIRRQEWYSSLRPWKACIGGHVSVGWSSVIYFNEDFVGWGPEDWEFSRRLCTHHGYTPLYLDDITAYHLESPDAVSNVFRTGKHEEIVMYMKNIFRLFDESGDLPLEDVFFGFPKLALDKYTNTWKVVPRPAPSSYDLSELVERARNWLLTN